MKFDSRPIKDLKMMFEFDDLSIIIRFPLFLILAPVFLPLVFLECWKFDK